MKRYSQQAAGVSWLPDRRFPSTFQFCRTVVIIEGSLPGDSGGTAQDSHLVPPTAARRSSWP